MIGMVGIEIINEIIMIRLAKQWKRDDMAQIPLFTKQVFPKIKWDATYAEQLVGQHLLKQIEMAADVNINAVNTQKNIKEPEEEDDPQKRMDLIEMTQFTLSLKQTHSIQFPKNPTNDMAQLIHQTELFTENITEQGTVNYYAPGEELDCLVKALIIACFASRPYVENTQIPPVIVMGSAQEKPKPNIQEEANKLLGKRTGRARQNPLFRYESSITRF